MDHLLFLFIGNFGSTEIVIISIGLLLLIGGKKIPKLIHGIGRETKDYKSVFKASKTPKKDDFDPNKMKFLD